MRTASTRSPATRLGAAPADGVRLPETTNVGDVRLQVADLQRSLAYCREVLGLRVIEASVDVARLGAPGVDEALVTLPGVPGTTPVRKRGAFGLCHVAILLLDRASLGRLVAHLTSLGV